jgi:arylsulfatase A-like enzyme
LWIFVGVLALVAGQQALVHRASGPRPSIVLVVWDTCRADHVTPDGYSRPTTPRLADLASRGVTFRRCFTPSPWTPPAHASLFTGLLPRNHGLRETRTGRVRMGIPLLAETLRDAGYETVGAVANSYISVRTGLSEGFESFFICVRPGDEKAPASAVVDCLRGWLRARREQGPSQRPVFLFVNLMDTHVPVEFDAAAVEAVRGPGEVEGARLASSRVTQDEANAHLFGVARIDDETLRAMNAAYDGAVRLDDAATGRILDMLRGEGLLENSLVAVTADHGECLGEHDEVGHMTVVHEPVLAVPLVLHWPGRFDGGRTEVAQVRLQDLYPTVLEAARVAVPPACGHDAVALTEVPLRSRTLVAEYEAPTDFLADAVAAFPAAPPACFGRFHRSLLVVRDPSGAKYVETRPERCALGTPALGEELFDTAADPGEDRNLLAPGGRAEDRATADRLRAQGFAGR